MNRISFTALLATALLLPSELEAESAKNSAKAVSIPLDKIWAYEMPGTRNIRELDSMASDPTTYPKSAIYKITKFLSTYVPNEGSSAETAFIVVGTDNDALKSAEVTLSSRGIKQQVRQFEKDKHTELSLVYFSYATGWQPKIVSVEKSRNVIKVNYQFIKPEEPSFGAARFALIPLGKLKAGTFKVEIEQVAPVDYRGRPAPPKRDPERFVCNSFEFDVK